MTLRKRLCRFASDRRGVTSVMTALSIVVLIGFTGAAVDFGSVFLQTRQLQGMTDLAAMAAANDLTQAQTAAQETVAQNNWSQSVTTSAVTGTYTPDSGIPVSERFVSNATPANAARVTLSSTANLYFASMLLGRKSLAISRTATAAQAELASFSIGTRLASLQGGVANALLSGLTGSSVSLSVMDYNSLASAQVDLFQYTKALATRLNLKAATFNQTLETQTTSNVALGAIADVLNAGGQTAAGSAISAIANAANQQAVTVGQLIDVGPYGDQDYIETNGPSGFAVNALDLADAVLLLAQGGHQVSLNLSSVIPGVSSVTTWLAIGERPTSTPWLAISDSNSMTVRTAQTRLYLDAQVLPSGLPGGVSAINLPVYVELASAKAHLSSVTCGPASSDESVTVSVAPSIGETAISSVNVPGLNDFSQEPTNGAATLINLPLLLNVTGQSLITVGGDDWQNVSFDSSDIQNGVVKTVETQNAVTATLTSLLGSLSLKVQLLGGLGLGLGTSGINSAVLNSLTQVAPSVDSTVNSLTALLGVGLGEADVWSNGARCQNVALVQ